MAKPTVIKVKVEVESVEQNLRIHALDQAGQLLVGKDRLIEDQIKLAHYILTGEIYWDPEVCA